MLITQILNTIHVILLLIPIVIYSVPPKKAKPYIKWILLIAALIPIHWAFLENSCIFTIWSKKAGDYQEAETTSEFSETNLRWLYEPIMRLFNWPWNSEGLNKMVNLHWIINILLIWICCFYYVYN